MPRDPSASLHSAQDDTERNSVLRRSQGHAGQVLLLEFLAPAFDFRVVEDLSDHAAEEALEVGILDVAQAADGFFLVAFKERAAAFVGAELEVESFDLGRRGG